jgi:PAS domain S-box-containing protein
MKTRMETKRVSPDQDADERRAETEAAQRGRKMRLHDVIEAMPTFAWTALPDGSIDFANRYWVEFTGLSIEESLGSGWEAAVHPEDVKRNREKWLASIKTGDPFECEVRYRSANGQYRWFLGRAVPQRNARGKIVKWYGISTDVEERKRAEDALRLSEACMARAQHLAGVGSWSYKSTHKDGHWNECEYWSAELWRIADLDPSLGFPSNETMFSRIHPEDRQRMIEANEQVIKDGRALDIKYRYFRADGQIRLLHTIATPIYENGAATRLVGATMDITEEEQTQEALRGAKARFEGILEIAEDAIVSMDSGQRIVLFNQGAERVFGYASNEVMGKPLDILLPQRFAHSHRGHIEGFAKSPEVSRSMAQRREVFGRRKDGSEFPAEASISKLVLGSEVVFTVILRDITERKRAEEALRRNETLLAEGERISHTGSWVYKPATDELTSSKERFRIFGLDPEKTPSSTQVFSERVHTDDKPRLRKILDSAIREKKDFEFEYRIVTPHGTLRHVHTVAHAIINESGELVEFFGSTADITERKRAEEALRRSEFYLAEAQKLTHTGSWARNPATGEFLYCSEEMLRIFGWDLQSGLPSKEIFAQRIHPDDLERVLQNIQKARQQKTDYGNAFRIVLPDGTVKYIQALAHFVVGETGEVVEWFGTVMDVTERKRSEEELRRSEAFLAEGQRISHTGSWVWNPTTGMMTSSKERFRIFGLDPEKTKPSFDVFWERVHPEDKPRFKRVFDAAVREKRDFNIGCRIVTPDWVIKHIHTVAHAITNESGELIEFIGSTMDITERKRAEERAQSQNNEVKLALNAFVEQLDLNRFLGQVLTGLTKQFQATASELWLSEESSSVARLFMSCQQGKVVWADEREPTAQPPGATHVTRERPDIGRTPRIIELPAHKSLLRSAHRESLKHQGIKTLLLVPLVLGEQNLGFVELRFAVATRLTSEDLNFAQALVHHATLALQLSRLAHRTEQMAVTEERNRMAREIHDTLAQAFAGIVLHAEALGTSLEGSKARSRKSLLNIQKLARSGLEEARRSVQALRPKALDNRSLTQALEEETRRFSEDAKLSCEFKQRGKALEMPVEMQNELFRVAQEAMTNLRKHARAKSAWINLEFKSRRVILTIRDNGVGLAATNSSKRKQGYGMATMRERALRIGGRLEIESPASGGTTIRVEVALAEKEKSSNNSL